VSEVLVEGSAEGEVLLLAEPLSFWGGVDETTGLVIDVHHPQQGECITGRILALPSGRGSSSSSSVLAELIRANLGPAAIILAARDPIIALGALVAEALYGRTVPVVVLAAEEWTALARLERASLQAADGTVRVHSVRNLQQDDAV
jgi:predicted aconitase with swiveling domain